MEVTCAPTNEDIIRHAVDEIIRRKNEVSASADFLGGFFAALDFMDPGYDEADKGTPYRYLQNTWKAYQEGKGGSDVSLQAKFKQMNTTDGATKLVFELHSRYLGLMPSLIPMNGNNVCLDLSDPQQRLDLIDQQKRTEEVFGEDGMAEELPLEGLVYGDDGPEGGADDAETDD